MANLQAEDFERSGVPLASWTDENMDSELSSMSGQTAYKVYHILDPL
jgi:hypothetical protein